MKVKLLDELGDVQWYLTLAAAVLGYSLMDVIAFNQSKLVGRYGPGGSRRLINQTYANILPEDLPSSGQDEN